MQAQLAIKRAPLPDRAEPAIKRAPLPVVSEPTIKRAVLLDMRNDMDKMRKNNSKENQVLTKYINKSTRNAYTLQCTRTVRAQSMLLAVS